MVVVVSATPGISITGTQDLNVVKIPSVPLVVSASHCCRQVSSYGRVVRDSVKCRNSGLIYFLLTAPILIMQRRDSDCPNLSHGPMFSFPQQWRKKSQLPLDHMLEWEWRQKNQSPKRKESETDYWGNHREPGNHTN